MSLILFLLIETQVVWGSWYRILRSILQPFIIGLVLAYVMHPLMEFLEKKGIPKNFSTIAVWVYVLMFLIMMLVMLMPVLYDKTNEFITSMINGVVQASNKVRTLGNIKGFSLVSSITNDIVNILQPYDDQVPQLMSSLPGLMNTVLSVVTNVLSSVIAATYTLPNFEHIKCGLQKFIHLFFKNSDTYLHEADQSVTVCLKSLITLMSIKFIEYSALCFMIGHQDWLITSLLTSLGVIIPYPGGTIANSIGIITTLILLPGNIVALIISIMILSDMDACVISPLVREKCSAMGSLIILLVVFAEGVITEAVRIMVNVPVTVAIKTAIGVYEQRADRRLCDNAVGPDV